MLLLKFLKIVYYYLKCSYKVWQVKHSQKDDLIYITKQQVEIQVYPGKKTQSPYDFIVKFKEPGKRKRTPAHVHLIVEMYVKYAYDPALTLKLKEQILTMLSHIKPITTFPPTFQFFKKTTSNHLKDWTTLENLL